MPHPKPTHPRPLGVEPGAARPKAKHTPEPWYVNTELPTQIYATGEAPFGPDLHPSGVRVLGAVADCDMPPRRNGWTNESNAAHIVACVNALAGLRPEAVAGLVEALEGLIHRLDAEHVGHSWAPLADAREALRRVKGEE